MKPPLAGFRFSTADALILLAGAVGSWALFRAEMPLWWVVPMAVGHFFLFCNVFRIRRALELAWAASFLANVVFWLTRLSTDWMPPALTQLPFTAAAILAGMRSPGYHGIFASRINPRLSDYLQFRPNNKRP